jgi:hypothetical protein
MNNIILIAYIIPLLYGGGLYQNPPGYKEFNIGDKKKNVLNILLRQKYSKHSIYYNNNDRYIGGIKVKSENSIKIVINSDMEKEEILLVFDADDILFDIYSRKRPMDIRDYIDYRVYMIGKYGKPVDEQVVSGRHILAWSLNRKRHVIYMIFNNVKKNIMINYRDTYLNMKYTHAE